MNLGMILKLTFGMILDMILGYDLMVMLRMIWDDFGLIWEWFL